MKIRLTRLLLRARQSEETIEFSDSVTFIHGPIGKGKSTVARLVDYCFGGRLERTPAIQSEFVSVTLFADLGDHQCAFERSADDSQSVRVSWSRGDADSESISAPIAAQQTPIYGREVFGLSDLIFFLCGISPIKVRQRSRDPNSPLIRLSFRDIWRFCYLDQTHLDSSFYRLEDPIRGRKSQDAMRFFTGLHSERLSQLESELFRVIDDQRVKRESVQQLRAFMVQFGWGTDLDLEAELAAAEQGQRVAESSRANLEQSRVATTHPTDSLRQRLRQLGEEVQLTREAIEESERTLSEQIALRAELITAKTRSVRADQAGRILEGVSYIRCPECGTDISDRPHTTGHCHLCGSNEAEQPATAMQLEVLRTDLNERIDQIADSISRRQRAVERMRRELGRLLATKQELDSQLQRELARYDSAFVESIRTAEREIATFAERIRSLRRLQQMPQAIQSLEEDAGNLQGRIDVLRADCDAERARLRAADEHVAALATNFKTLLLSMGFPGLSDSDEIVLEPRNWAPFVSHGEQLWGFWDTGSGGKKTLFNVCYALALHRTAVERHLPVPNLLIVDSPTKNISLTENAELVAALYREIYRQASEMQIQFLLIDSKIVSPATPLDGFSERRMAGEPDAPSLISYYSGP
jgi:hypothetical protein